MNAANSVTNKIITGITDAPPKIDDAARKSSVWGRVVSAYHQPVQLIEPYQHKAAQYFKRVSDFIVTKFGYNDQCLKHMLPLVVSSVAVPLGVSWLLGASMPFAAAMALVGGGNELYSQMQIHRECNRSSEGLGCCTATVAEDTEERSNNRQEPSTPRYEAPNEPPPPY